MQTKFKLSALVMNTGQIKGLPKNPRQWSQGDVDRLAKSIEETPELLDARPLIVVQKDSKFVVLGGNLRLAALRKLNWEAAPCFLLSQETPVEKLKEIVIKDNGSFGAWDYDALANEWSDLDLSGWGAGIPDDWGKITESAAQPHGGSSVPGAENLLPPELQGVDINPDDLPKIQGDGETAMERVIIVFTKDRAPELANLLGLGSIEKVIYRLEEIIPQSDEG